MDKYSIEIMTESQLHVRTRRFQFCPKQSRLYSLFAILLAFVIIVLAIMQIFIYSLPANSSESDTKVSSRNGHVNHNITTIDNQEPGPCNNFYNFACQAWQKENPRPEGQNKWTVFAVQYYKINKLVIDILEEEIQDHEINAIIQAKNLYRKCLNENITVDSVLKETIGQTGYPLINELCKESVKKFFNIAIAHKIAVFKFGDVDQLENIKNGIQEMFENMRNWFHHLDTRSLSNSVNQTKLCVGLPNWIFNRTRVQAEYDELYLNLNATYGEQIIAARHWLLKSSTKNESVLNSECPWADSMGFDGAYYLRSKNLIYLPLGFLEPPYYGKSRSVDQNYGSLGSVIGHELAHAYLVQNADNIKNSTLKCLQSQHNSFTGQNTGSHNVPLNLDRKIHEDLADNLGLAAAYNAWKGNNKAENFTNEQLFFSSFAQKWCESPSKTVLGLEEHSPGNIRVLGTLQNSKEFAKAWNCPIGSIMNPSPSHYNKCQFVFK